ncbi:DUF3152 domain-containing protein [Asanoa sp. NPDC049573]|uniref:DUF3152 domain-containing protein n=1 Tax=Asanoa sp. NPDC049573 TaxID=3155396 RepID=UPI0034423DAE
MATPIPGTPLRDTKPDQPAPARRASWRVPLLVAALLATAGAVGAVVMVNRPADEHLSAPVTSTPAEPAPNPPPSQAQAQTQAQAPTQAQAQGQAQTQAQTQARAPSPPHTGPGVFSTDLVSGPPLGSGTQTQHFHVAVEKGIGLDLAPFAASVDAVLGDPRSWIADGRLRLQRVGAAEPADFTIYLASAGTSERMCAEGGLDTDAYTSCQLGGEVIINADRWLGAVPEFEAPLGLYQAYAVNHEVGHQLGHQHEACPSPGAAAPVMQQQTLGMQGCLPNGWPYLDGRRQTGPPIP